MLGQAGSLSYDARGRTVAELQRCLNYIDGEFLSPCSERYMPVYEPATGQVYAEVAASDPSASASSPAERAAKGDEEEGVTHGV